MFPRNESQGTSAGESRNLRSQIATSRYGSLPAKRNDTSVSAAMTLRLAWRRQKPDAPALGRRRRHQHPERMDDLLYCGVVLPDAPFEFGKLVADDSRLAHPHKGTHNKNAHLDGAS